MKTIGTGVSVVGPVREGNEDYGFSDDKLGLYIVCDGMGGHQAGEVASRLAVDTAVAVVRSRKSASDSGPERTWSAELVSTVQEAITEACATVYETARREPGKAGMGCTMTVLLVSDCKAAMGHVGDTRLYLLRDERVHQLSSDHTMAAHLAKIGAIPADQIRTHKFANVLIRSIGTQRAVEIDTLNLDLSPGDRLVLCSDGLSQYLLDPGDLLRLLKDGPEGAFAERLIDFANGAGGSDNTTVVTVDVRGADGERAAPAAQLNTLSKNRLFDEDFFVHLLRLLDEADVVEFDDGQVVVERGAPNTRMFIPIRGSLRVSGSEGESREAVHGDVIGATSLLHPRPARATVTAHGRCRVLAFDSASLNRLLRRHPWFGLRVLERLGEYLSEKLDAVETYDGQHTL